MRWQIFTMPEWFRRRIDLTGLSCVWQNLSHHHRLLCVSFCSCVYFYVCLHTLPNKEEHERQHSDQHHRAINTLSMSSIVINIFCICFQNLLVIKQCHHNVHNLLFFIFEIVFQHVSIFTNTDCFCYRFLCLPVFLSLLISLEKISRYVPALSMEELKEIEAEIMQLA
mgnify:CR=1 FL=1